MAYDPNWRAKALAEGKDQNSAEFASMRAMEASQPKPFDQGAFMSDMKRQQDEALAKQKSEREAFQRQQEEKETGFLSKFKDTISGQETLSAMADRIGGELNLPALRDSAKQLMDTLRNVPQMTKTATTGFDVSANQRDRMVASQQGKLAPGATAAQQNLSDAERLLGQRLELGQKDQMKALMPLEMEAKMLSDRLAREFTGFTKGQEDELSGLLQRLNTGAQLTMQEMQYAQTLALKEMEFDQQRSLYDTQFQNDLKKMELGQGYDMEKIKFSTDEAIRQSNATKSGGSPGTINFGGMGTGTPANWQWSDKAGKYIVDYLPDGRALYSDGTAGWSNARK